MSIREFYLKAYPSDEVGFEIDPKATFIGLLDSIYTGSGVYCYIGVADSLVRERVFIKLADLLGKPYDYVINIWLR